MRVVLALLTAILVGSGLYALAVPDSAQPGALTTRAAAATETAGADASARRLIVGLDISKSNPLVDDAGFARKVAQRITAQVKTLGLASEVHVRTFGSYGTSANAFYYDVVISRNHRPEDVAADVEKLVAGTPLLIRKGAWKSQDKTNIIAFLDNVATSIGCARMPTTVVLVSDGIEDSEYARLQHAGDKLPAPNAEAFRGCEALLILGLGQGQKSPSTTTRLRAEWREWASAAGFAEFSGLNDW